MPYPLISHPSIVSESTTDEADLVRGNMSTSSKHTIQVEGSVEVFIKIGEGDYMSVGSVTNEIQNMEAYGITGIRFVPTGTASVYMSGY